MVAYRLKVVNMPFLCWFIPNIKDLITDTAITSYSESIVRQVV